MTETTSHSSPRPLLQWSMKAAAPTGRPLAKGPSFATLVPCTGLPAVEDMLRGLRGTTRARVFPETFRRALTRGGPSVATMHNLDAPVGAVHAGNGGELFKWTRSSTSRKYHYADSLCAASQRVDAAAWEYGRSPGGVPWELCKLCRAARRRAAGNNAAACVEAEEQSALSDDEFLSLLGRGTSPIRAAWAGGNTDVGGQVNVVDPAHFAPRGALQVLRDAGWFVAAPSKPASSFPSVPQPPFGLHVPRVQQLSELWRWLASTWLDSRTVYSITALSGCGKSTLLADVVTNKNDLPDEEPTYMPISSSRSLEDVKTAFDPNDETKRNYGYRSWEQVRGFAGATVVFGISFNAHTAFSSVDLTLAKRGLLLPLFLRIIISEHCHASVPWATVLTKFENLTYGPDGDVDVDVIASEVLRILRNKRGTPHAPALLIVDELSQVGDHFEAYRRAFYEFCSSVNSFRVLFSAMEVAFLTLLRDRIEYHDERTFWLKNSPTVVSTATVVPPLPQTELVGELEKVIFAPGHLVFMRAGRAVEPKEGAQSVAALSGGIGRYLSYALDALLRGARGTSVLLLLQGASSSASKGLEAGAAASIISTTSYDLPSLSPARR